MTQQTFAPVPYPSPTPYAPPPFVPAPTAATSRRFGPSAGLGLLGAAALGTAFTVLPWYRKDYGSIGGGATMSTFGDIHRVLDKLQGQLQGNPFASLVDVGFSPTFFSWLGWALLAAAVVATAIATSPAGNGAARTIGALVGVVGLGVTAWNLQLVTFAGGTSGSAAAKVPDSWLDWFAHTSFGAWAALLGFALLAVAAAVGPRRR